MDRITKAKQKLGEIGAVLPGDAGDKSNPPFQVLSNHIHSNKASGLLKAV